MVILKNRHGAVRIACADGAIWVTHLKGRGKNSPLPRIKLPATQIIPDDVINTVPDIMEPEVFKYHDQVYRTRAANRTRCSNSSPMA